MASKLSKRLQWAIDIMHFRPQDQVAEIGCGDGKTCLFISERLHAGCVVGIDASQAQIERGKALIQDRGNAELRCARLGESCFAENERFNIIFAFNVNLFWTEKNCATAWDELRAVLKAGGRIYLFYHFPSGRDEEPVRHKLLASISASGFGVKAWHKDAESGSFGVELARRGM